MKYIDKKVIKGKTYYYIQYKGQSKNLGTSLPIDLHNKFIDFFAKIGLKLYADIPEKIKAKFKYGGLEKLESLHGFHILLNHDLFNAAHDRFYDKFIKLFTYHSNRAEGSKVTKKEIDEYTKSKIRTPKTRTEKEIFNSFMAFQHAVSNKMKWNMKHIRHIHDLLLNGLDPMIAGHWKKENNTAPNNQPTTDYKKVQTEMKKLLEWFNNEFKKDIYPPELAIKFYVKFESIHPFLDGNGRVGRILLSAILHSYNYPPVIFFSENWRRHCDAILKAREGRWDKIYKHFLEQVKKTGVLLTKKTLGAS